MQGGPAIFVLCIWVRPDSRERTDDGGIIVELSRVMQECPAILILHVWICSGGN